MAALQLSSMRVGLDAMRVNPMRTILSTLGIIMGVASMVAVLSMGDGVEKYARDVVSKSSDALTVTVMAQFVQRLDGIFVPRTDVVSFSLADTKALQAVVPEAEFVLASQSGGAVVQRDSASARRGMSASAVLPGALQARKLTVREGRFVTDADVEQGAAVAVLTASGADTLTAHGITGTGSAMIGRTILANGHPFTVVGILQRDETRDRPGIIVPFGAAGGVLFAAGGQERIALGGVARGITLYAKRVEDVPLMLHHTERFMARRYGQAWKKRVDVVASEDRVKLLTQGLRVFTLFLSALTGVSLLVGGVGIMNVLLASVAERTREIGIRKAMGARNRDILVQFLAESVAITSTGSAIGVLLGLGIAAIGAAVMRIQTEAPVHAAITFGTLFFAAAASIVVGLTFGLYPAVRASRLSPIDAIRHE